MNTFKKYETSNGKYHHRLQQSSSNPPRGKPHLPALDTTAAMDSGYEWATGRCHRLSAYASRGSDPSLRLASQMGFGATSPTGAYKHQLPPLSTLSNYGTMASQSVHGPRQSSSPARSSFFEQDSTHRQNQSFSGDCTPSLVGGDSTLFDTGDSLEASDSLDLSFPDFNRADFSKDILKSSATGMRTLGETRALYETPGPFFEDFTGLHTGPRESTPRKSALPPNGNVPSTLPRAALAYRRSGRSSTVTQQDGEGRATEQLDSSSGYNHQLPPSSAASSKGLPSGSPKSDDSLETAELRHRLINSEDDRKKLDQRCEELSNEVALLRELLHRLSHVSPQNHHFREPASPAPGWGPLSPASTNSFGAIAQPKSDWVLSHLPTHDHRNTTGGTSEMKSLEGSPSMNYIGLSLINSIQAQLQAGVDGHAGSPEIGHSPSAMTASCNYAPQPSPAFFVPSPSSTAYSGHASQRNGDQSASAIAAPAIASANANAAAVSPAWLHFQHQSTPPVVSFGDDRAGSDSLSTAHQQLPTLPPKPRFSAPAAPYVPASMLGGNSDTRPSHVAQGRLAGMDASASPEILVARALAGRSQEGSVLLQQQLKSGPPERQAAIIRAISPHLIALSEDKHGNFLVQRAIGVDVSVAWGLKGHFVRLAMSQYGCHVVQRVLDEDEPLKKQVVEELLRQELPETLTSRNAVHVWAKALEIKWSSEEFRATVFEVINKAMKGRWAATAMQETGSIVVQNLFESAEESEKKECVNEILERLPECSANQWGVWVVQHIIEHGSPSSRNAAFDKLLSEAASLSLSQFGQKAIMTALKSKELRFISGYLDQLCDGDGASGGSTTSGRRSMLVEIASTPQGLQIMTQLLTTVSADDRERIIKAVRRNSVFLKGSKTGLKVHQMCERARAFTGY